MPDTEVTVHVNRRATNELEPAAETLETDGSVTLRLQGHEAPAHVHCRLDGDLKQIASVDQSNYYVEPGAVTTVPIAVENDIIERPIDGQLEVLTGYGSEAITIAVTVVPGPPEVDVDESLAEPARRELNPMSIDPATLAVLGLGLFALVLATVTAATIASPVSIAGFGIVVVGVGIAFFLLVW